MTLLTNELLQKCFLEDRFSIKLHILLSLFRGIIDLI